MTRQEQLAYCRICHNKEMSAQGLICKLTQAKADFDPVCENFDLDEVAQAKREARERELAASEADNDFFAAEKKGLKGGVLGGLAMIVIAVVWFVVGYQAGYIYFYPPILFVIGLVGLIKGLIDGNASGEKYRR